MLCWVGNNENAVEMNKMTLVYCSPGECVCFSSPACYAAEFSELKTTEKGGVPLEHMISCVPGVQVVVSKSGIKKVQWAENKVPSSVPGENIVVSVPGEVFLLSDILKFSLPVLSSGMVKSLI